MRISVKVMSIFMLVFLICVSAYAGDTYSSSQELDIFVVGTNVNTGDGEQAISLSPNVAAFYRTAGTDSTNQFYSIATGHTGGDTAYGAASNASNVYVNPFTPGEFTSADLSADLPDAAVSADAWAGGWDRM